MDLNIKARAIKLLEETGDYFHDLGWGGGDKSKKIKSVLNQNWVFVYQKNIINRQATGQEMISAKHVRQRTGILNTQNAPKTQ